MSNIYNIYSFLWKYRRWLLLLVLAFTFLFRLGSHVLYPWDEARNAVNSQEMYHNNNFLVTHFNGEPDMWNTKPPVLMWLQVACMYLVGENEWAIRLPSAIAAIGVCLVILTFFKNYLHDELGGYIAVLILVSTKAFTLIHGARRGDFDSVLIFFQVLSVLKFYEYFLTKKSKKLYVAFIAIAFAVLTKSIVGFLILPGLIFASVLFEKFHFVYKNKHLYFALVSCLLVIAIYYLLRNYYNPGYLLAVYENELGGRYLNALEGNKGYMLLYFHGLTARYLLWLFFVPLGVYVAHQKEGMLKEFVSVLSLIVVIFFLIISSSKTKLLWYDLPIYPFLGMIIATYFSQNKGDESTLGKMYVFSIVFMFNYAFIVKQVINNHSTFPRALGTFNVATYLKNKINEGVEGKKINIINQDEESVNVNRFYINKLKSLNNVVNYVSMGDLIDGDIVVVCKPVEEEQIIGRYEVRLLENYEGVKLYTIKQ